jgi:predicted dehydrogenase
MGCDQSEGCPQGCDVSFGVILVGLGQIGMGYDKALDPARFVTTHARAFSRHPEFHLVAGVDTNPVLRREFEARYECRSYPSIGSALESHSADVAVIALPTEFHGPALDQILAHCTPLVVLCEKPLAYDAAGAENMVRSCEERGVSLYVNYMRRSDPGVIEVKRRLDAELIATPVKGRVWYTKGWLHNASHFFNLLEYWLGPMNAVKVLKTRPAADENFVDLDAWISFERGEITFLAAWEKAFSHSEIELFSPSGRLRLGSDTRHINWQAPQADERFAGYNVLAGEVEEIPTMRERYQFQVANQLALALNKQPAHLCTGADALKTLTNMRKVLELTS